LSQLAPEPRKTSGGYRSEHGLRASSGVLVKGKSHECPGVEHALGLPEFIHGGRAMDAFKPRVASTMLRRFSSVIASVHLEPEEVEAQSAMCAATSTPLVEIPRQCGLAFLRSCLTGFFHLEVADFWWS